MTDRPILLEVPYELVAKRIVVRPFRDQDAREVHDAIRESREHILPWLPWPDRHASVDDTLAYVRRTQAQFILRESFGLGIFSRESKEFLGGAGLHPRDWQIGSFEIGYWVTKPAEGKGYVSEATKLLTQLAFERLSAQRVMIRCDTRNQRSKAVPERLGYSYEGTIRNEIPDTDGRPRDTLVYPLIPEEYVRLKQSW